MKRKLPIVLSIILLMPIMFYLIYFHYGLSENSNEWGQFGSYIGGIYGPIGLLVLSYSIYQSSKQFRIEKEDNLFYKILDNQQQRIINFIIKDDLGETKSYETLKYLVTKLSNEIETKCVGLGRKLLCNMPEKIDSLYYEKILQAKYSNYFTDFTSEIEALRTDLININENERWEVIKKYVGGVGSESEKQHAALRTLGSVYFYKIEFEEFRSDIYSSVFYLNDNNYGSFYDGYFKNLQFIIDFIQQSKSYTTYTEYLIAQLTRYEKVFIFYYLASGKAKKSLCTFVEENKILDDLMENNNLLIDIPSKKELTNELFEIYKIYKG
jgi:hypothetical protein